MPVFSQSSLTNAAYAEFQCAPLSQGANPEKRVRARLRKEVDGTVASFSRVMADNPGMSREDAVRLTVGGLKMLLGFFFPYIALAISVAGWLWDYTHASGDSVIVTVTARNDGQMS